MNDFQSTRRSSGAKGQNVPFITMEISPRPHLLGLLAGLFIAGGLVLASLVVASAWTRIAESQVVNVTGSAHRDVRSDLVVWHASFAVEDEALLGAHVKLKADQKKVEAFFAAHGVKGVSFQPVQIQDITARKRGEDDEMVSRRVGYRLTQRLEVTSSDVDGTPRLATEAAALLQQGVALMSGGFEFIYTKAGEAKVEMMADATRDARARAEQIAGQGGRGLKELRAAHMGVMQINPLYSSATSWEGNNDTSALEKTITATVTETFSLK